ncbi:DUF397 domain-containing protein [Streptomyces sp. Da 82-17]|uniref:DUF397 domain-containing protein n=1 Tax=Streptomyces sp. Da 82-17 TaxID=3377116 RepID=UPI0038D3B3E6
MNSTEELAWFKSSYSSGEGGECIEVALDWRKSTYSGGGGGDCVEVAQDQHHLTLHIRDSKHPTHPHITTTPAAWSAFVTYARR